MRNLLVTADDFRGLEDLLVERVGALREEDPFSKVRILAGSDLLCRYLKTILTRRLGGIFNLELLTFPRLLSGAAAAAGVERGPDQPPFFERMMIEKLKEELLVPRGFDEISGSGGFSVAMAESVSDLAEAGMSGSLASKLAGTTAGPRRLGDLLDFYFRFREKVERFGGDSHSLISKVVGSDLPAGSAEPPLLVYGFYDMNEEQWQLLLGSEKNGMILYVPRPEGRPGRFSRSFIELAAGSGFEEEHPVREEDDALPATGFEASVEIMNAYDSTEEAGLICSNVLGMAARGTAFVDMAIITPPGYDDSQLKEILSDSDIPFYSKETPLLESNGDARTILALAGLMEGRPDRRQLTDIVMMLRQPQGESDQGWDPFATWVRTSAEAGLTGDGGWIEENSRLIENTRAAVERGRVEKDVLDSLLYAAGKIEIILRLSVEKDEKKSWSSRVDELISVYLEVNGQQPHDDPVIERVNELRALDRVSDGCFARLFSSLLSASLSRPLRSGRRFQLGGLSILPLAASRGLRFDAIFLPGLTEDHIPGRAGRDPFLSDDSKDILEKETKGVVRFSKRIERPAELELLLRLAAGAARERLVLSWPRREKGTGKEKIPSSMIDKVLSPVEAASPVKMESSTEGGVRAAVRIPAGSLFSGARPPLNEHEYSLMAVAKGGREAAPLLGNRFFDRSLKMTSERWKKKKLTPYDGAIASGPALKALREYTSPGRPGYSPTALERWASCPFAYFLSDILKVSSVEEPEAVLTIDPLQRGILVHAIMEDLYRTLEKRGLLPVSGHSLEKAAGEALSLMEKKFIEFAAEHQTGPEVFWKIEMERIVKGVISSLEAEAFEAGGLVPTMFEYSFGSRFRSHPVRFETGSRVVEFYGRIDRLDRGDSGRFQVIDYKTGRLRGKDDDLGLGTALQLPVYLLAASALLETGIESGSASYVSVSAHGGKKRVSLSGAGWKTLRVEFAEILDVIVGGIESGLFFASPAKGGCRGCDGAVACPTSRIGLFEMKASADERCEGFLRMKEGGGR